MDNGYLYAEAQRANTAKDQFLATLSHELRTPLNAIVGLAEHAASPEVMRPEGVPKAWAAIDRNTEMLTELIEDLLDVSRIATGKDPPGRRRSRRQRGGARQRPDHGAESR